MNNSAGLNKFHQQACIGSYLLNRKIPKQKDKSSLQRETSPYIIIFQEICFKSANFLKK